MKIIYTPFTNLKKTGDMAVGQVAFHNDRKVKRGKFDKLLLLHIAVVRRTKQTLGGPRINYWKGMLALSALVPWIADHGDSRHLPSLMSDELVGPGTQISSADKFFSKARSPSMPSVEPRTDEQSKFPQEITRLLTV